MKYYVVIDTNVILSSFLSNDSKSSTVQVIEKLYDGNLIPLYSEEILNEYKDVLNRTKFKIQNSKIGTFFNFIKKYGIKLNPDKLDIELLDEEDVKFYELVMDKSILNDKYLITGNLKHFPKNPIIVTPAEFIEIYNRKM